MKILNTLSGQKEDLVPIKDNKVNMFVCGPTVYDHIHIGNARTFVFFDVIAKYLKHRGYDVNYIQNITDIDNKIIEQAQKEGVNPLEYAKKYTEIFKEDMKALGITSPKYKNATDHIPEVIKQVQTLLDKGNAYVIENDPAPNLSADRHSEKGRAWGGAGGIYFDISTFPDYGKLSGRTAGMADDAVSRIDDSDKKRNRGDFAIWKFSQKGDPAWNLRTGKYMGIMDSAVPAFAKASAGRPGWHIEDTAITEKYFGSQYDIHGGGQDLIFPHHEAEIAQQESASGLKPFVKYWMHVGFLVNKEQKMSKSLGNFITIRDLLKRHALEAVRFMSLSAHYRMPFDYNEKIIQQSDAGVRRIYEFIQKLNLSDGDGKENAEARIEKAGLKFHEAMSDDFNTPQSFAAIFNLIKDLNPFLAQNSLDKNSVEKAKNFIKEVGSILGIVPPKQEKIPDGITKLVEKREKFREEKNWEKADKTRAQIEKLGYGIEDTIYGPLTVKK